MNRVNRGKVGVYIHIPFCNSKCDYCNFYSLDIKGVEKWTDLKDRYIDTLLEEISFYSDRASSYGVDTIYMGGGTPSLLPTDDINLILETIRKKYHLEKDCEITIETNPENSNIQRLNDYKSMGINRVTLGIQTINQRDFQTMGRKGSLVDKNLLDDFFSVRDISHSIDIIAGIPGQNSEEFQKEVETLIGYYPEHISAYLLTIEEGTALSKRFHTGDNLDNLQVKLFGDLISQLKRAGYDHYEVSNFARDNNYSRHNMKYWNFNHYLGFGTSAHSFFENQRWQNRSTIYDYIKNYKDKIIDHRDKNQEIVEFIMTSLRLTKGLSLKRYGQLFGEDLPSEIESRMEKLIHSGHVKSISTDDDRLISITADGFFISDEIIYKIVEPLI